MPFKIFRMHIGREKPNHLDGRVQSQGVFTNPPFMTNPQGLLKVCRERNAVNGPLDKRPNPNMRWICWMTIAFRKETPETLLLHIPYPHRKTMQMQISPLNSFFNFFPHVKSPICPVGIVSRQEHSRRDLPPLITLLP